ncbi:MAG: amidohydrolase [Thermodesulfobacteriota bacterium]
MAAEKLFLNADLVTLDLHRPEADACLVHGDRFRAVGSEAELRRLTASGAEVVDLGGKTVLPGFIETHNHLSIYALSLGLLDCSPYANAGLADLKARIKAAAGKTGAGQWIVGWGYDDTLVAEARHLHRRDLDEAAPDHPVFIFHISWHLAYGNSLALKISGISRDTPQPAGGEIHRDERGEPTGLLLEPGAMFLAAGHLPKADAAVYRSLLPEAVARFNREGVTSVHDGGVGALHGREVVQAYRSLEIEGRLNLRVYLTMLHDFHDRFLELGLGRGFGSDYLKIGAVKLLQDGSIQGLTAALTEDYHNRPGFRGWTIRSQQDLDDLALKYHGQGLQIAIHANGDAAIESAITALERAQDRHPQPPLRHMIIHCQMASDNHLRRMKILGLIPSYFANHVYYWGDRHLDLFLGPRRAARLNPLAGSVRADLPFTLHADTPVTPVSPLASIHNAVNRLTRNGTRLGPEERISPLEAIKAYTVNAAYCSFEEASKGSLSPGKLADFVVLDKNPLKVNPAEIKDIKIEMTVVGGRTVFSSALP